MQCTVTIRASDTHLIKNPRSYLGMGFLEFTSKILSLQVTKDTVAMREKGH